MFQISKASLFPILIIIIISFLTFSPSFKLALFGDDWLAFFRFKQHIDPGTGQWNYFSYYLTPYGAQDIIMGLLYKIYGFNSSYYYLTSYILRLIAAFSLYPLVMYLTKSKISSLYAVTFFSLTTIGLDTTNWVFNMPSYITISLFFVSLYFFISQRDDQKVSRLLISGTLYYLAYITAPIRMHGSLVFLFLIEFFWFLQNRNSKTLKAATMRFSLMLFVFLIVRFAGHSQGPAIEASERFLLGINASQELLRQGRFDFLFYPLVMIGSMILPDLMLIASSINSYKQIITLSIPVLLISCSISFIILKIINRTTLKFNIYLFLSLVSWTLITSIIARGNLTTFGNSSLITLLLVGGYTFIFALFLLFYSIKQKNTSTAIFLSMTWITFSFFFAWWWVPTSIFPTTYRYLIIPAAGVSILFSIIIALGKSRLYQLFIFLFLTPFIFINISSSRSYFNQLLINHGQETSTKIWSSIPYVPELKSSKKPFIFYFDGDGTNGGILHDVITFGFPPHMALIYNLTASDPIPVPMSDFKELTSAVINGKTMPAYGYKAEPVDINHIYAFNLQGQNTIIDITELTRKKLIQISQLENN